MSVELNTAAVRVRVPATSANLGPGYDCAGLALDLFDELTVVATSGGLEIDVVGEGAGDVPRDETHLVVSSLIAGLAAMGASATGLKLSCINRIPHGRGLGSSSAAIVGGLALARGLVPEEVRMSDTALLELATDIEGHPDNVAPALLGGFTLAWTEVVDGSATTVGRAVCLAVDERIVPVVAIPSSQLATARARELLPKSVPLGDAAFVAGRAALLVQAMTHRPDLLMQATEDRLHQDYRRFAYPDSYALMTALRDQGMPAAISGAGPSVLALTQGDTGADAVEAQVVSSGGSFAVQTLRVSPLGAHFAGIGDEAIT